MLKMLEVMGYVILLLDQHHFNLFFSTKYTGVFTFFAVGFLTYRDLWKLTGNHLLPAVCTIMY